MEKIRFRNHFLMIVERICSLWLIWLYLILGLITGESAGEKLETILITGTITLIVLVINLIIWRKTTYIFDGKAIIVEKSTISKVTTTISLDNITSVNINRTLFQGILGIRTVKLDTNSTMSSNSELEICLKKNDALLFQKKLMDIINGENTDEKADEEVVSGETKENSKASLDEVFWHCVFTMKLVEIVVVAVSGAFFLLTEAELSEGDSVGGIMGIISTFIVAAGIIISFLKSFFAYYKLEAVRVGKELNISYGFFDKKTFKLPVDKVASIKLREPLIGRLFGKAYAEVVCVGMGDDEKELSLISLCTSKKLLAVKLKRLLPELMPEEIKSAEEFFVVKKENRKAIIVRGFKSIIYMGSLVVGAVVAINLFEDNLSELFSVFGIILMTMCALILVYQICRNFSSGYSVDSRYLRLTNGAFNRDTSIIPYKKIEYMTINKTPVYNILGLVSANIFVRSSAITGMVTQSCYIDDKDMEAIKERYHDSYRRNMNR